MYPKSQIIIPSTTILHRGRRKKSFHYKHKLTELILTKPAIQKIPEGILQSEEKDKTHP